MKLSHFLNFLEEGNILNCPEMTLFIYFFLYGFLKNILLHVGWRPHVKKIFRYFLVSLCPLYWKNRYCLYSIMNEIDILFQNSLKSMRNQENEEIFKGLHSLWPVFVAKILHVTFCSCSQLSLWCLPIYSQYILKIY